MSYLKSRGFKPRKPEKEESKNLAGPDAFQEQGRRLADQVAAHPYFVIGSVVFVIVAVVLVIVVSNWIHEKREARAALFVEAASLWEENAGRPGETDKIKAAVEKFGAAAEKNAGSFMGDVALFYKAKGHYRLKEFDTAVSLFKKLQSDSRIPEKLRFGAYEGEAYCHLDRGDHAAAAAVWERYLALSGAPLYRDFALYYAGKSYERLGNLEKAKEFFAQLQREFPESSLVVKVPDQFREIRKGS